MLDPKPRDFTTAGTLTHDRILETLGKGVPGTAMKKFAGTLSADEMDSVAAFVMDEFVLRKAPNTTYHTEANGWPDHRERYGAAFPFVLGQARMDSPVQELSPELQRGRRLYVDSCITCHEPKDTARLGLDAFPLSHMGQVIREPVDHISRASVYALHDLPLEIAGLTETEQAGRKLYDDNCAFCHARDGTGKNWIGSFLQPHPRNLTDRGQTAHITDDRLKTVIRDGLEGTSMPAWSAVLDSEQINAVAAYVRKAFLGKPKSIAPVPAE